jgi:DNA-binding transcriptional ArsR family regulator
MRALNDEMFERIAERFKALGEPARLRILHELREGALTVGAIGERTHLNQANLSKHLQLLYSLGFVTRSKHGLFVYYRLADEDVFELCDIMCGRVAHLQRARSRVPRTTPHVRRRPVAAPPSGRRE